jgi:hypothetical protein
LNTLMRVAHFFAGTGHGQLGASPTWPR